MSKMRKIAIAVAIIGCEPRRPGDGRRQRGRSQAARHHVDTVRRREGRQQGRHDSRVHRRHHHAAGGLRERQRHARRPVRRRQAALHHHREERRPVRRQAVRSVEGDVQEVPRLPDGRVPDAAQRRLPEERARQHGEERDALQDHRERPCAGSRVPRRHPVPDREDRRGNDVEPPAALPGPALRLPREDLRRRQLGPHDDDRRVHGPAGVALLHREHEHSGGVLPGALGQADDPLGRRDQHLLRLPEPGRNGAPRVDVLARPAPRARGARLRVRHADRFVRRRRDLRRQHACSAASSIASTSSSSARRK